MTGQFLKACVYVFEGCGVRYYSYHEKQMNWKVDMRFHHLFGKCCVEPWIQTVLQSLCDSVSWCF